MSRPTIVAMGGGGFSMEPDNPLLDDHVLALARAERGRERPRVCFLATASGDSPAYSASFYEAFARRAEASHLALFVRTVGDIEAFLLDFDEQLYGRWLTLELVERLRGEQRFAGVEALRQAIAADVARARDVLQRVVRDA